MLDDFLNERKHMVERQLRARGIHDLRVLAAFEMIPRHLFVPKESRQWAYEDCPHRIGFEQTISQPFIAAYMTQSVKLTGTERVLEIGAGSGYQTAILSQLVPEVHTVELIPALAERAAKTLTELKIKMSSSTPRTGHSAGVNPRRMMRSSSLPPRRVCRKVCWIN